MAIINVYLHQLSINLISSSTLYTMANACYHLTWIACMCRRSIWASIMQQAHSLIKGWQKNNNFTWCITNFLHTAAPGSSPACELLSLLACSFSCSTSPFLLSSLMCKYNDSCLHKRCSQLTFHVLNWSWLTTWICRWPERITYIIMYIQLISLHLGHTIGSVWLNFVQNNHLQLQYIKACTNHTLPSVCSKSSEINCTYLRTYVHATSYITH